MIKIDHFGNNDFSINHFTITAMSNKSGYSHPHTIFLHFSTIDVRNLHETPVTDTQFNSRSLIKAFTVAAAKARSLYGVSKIFKIRTRSQLTKIEF